MRHSVIQFFHISNLLQMLNDCRMVDIEFFSNLLCVQFSSVTQLCPTLWTAACQASLSITNSWSLFKLMCIKLVMPSNHLILCHPLLLLAFNLSQHWGIFQWFSSLHQVAKYWGFSTSPSNEYSHVLGCCKIAVWICNNFLQRKHFYNQQEAENAFQEVVESWSMDFYATRIKLISYWQKCVGCNDSYFDS